MKCIGWGLIALLALQGAQETRDSETVRHRELGEIVDEVARLADKAAVKDTDKVLIAWMIDNSSSLKNTRHGELFSDHIARAFAKSKAGVHHSVMTFAESPQLILKATNDARAAGRAIEWLAQQPADDKIKNCLANVREGAKYAGSFSGGKKFLVVYTPENGDNEDNVEATLKMLKDTGVVLIVIAAESVYSDPYWEALTYGNGSLYYGDANKYKKLKFQMKGPESAYIEFPYGWSLQVSDPSYTVPAGYGYWALDRLATHSGGTYFTYAPDPNAQTFCQRWACTLCSGQHKACGAAFDLTKLKMTAPCVESREECRERLSKDRLAVQIYAAWEKLFRAGYLRNSAALKVSGGGLSETKPQASSTSPFSFGNNWGQGRGVVKRALADIDKVIADFKETLEKLGPDAEKRTLATADALLVHLRLLRLNVNQLGYFIEECEEHDRKKAAHDDGFGGDVMGDGCG
jgi:hypothetical protein